MDVVRARGGAAVARHRPVRGNRRRRAAPRRARGASRERSGRLRNGGGNGTARDRERAVIAALRLPRQRRWEVEESLEELAGLAEAAGATVVHRMVQERTSPT